MSGLLRRFRNARGRWLGYGGCYRCGSTWNWAHHHDTPYGNGSACFPLCEECWAALPPQSRLVYYEMLVDNWIRQVPSHVDEYLEKRDRIREAVLAGG